MSLVTTIIVVTSATSRARMPVREAAKCAPSHWSEVWALVSEVLLEPERLKRGLRKMVEKERSVLRGNPEEEAKRLAEVERKRSSFQDMAAEGLITRGAPSETHLTRGNPQGSTHRTRCTGIRSERVAAIERDAEAVLRDYAGLMPEALATMAPEDRHRVYKMLRLKVLVYPDGSGELRVCTARVCL